MKQLTIGLFNSRENAERAIRSLYNERQPSTADIAYIYRNTEGGMREINPPDTKSKTGEGAAEGAAVGGTLGGLAGLATVAGLIPVIGPVFAAGPLVGALGLGGAAGTVVAGAATGIAAGSLVGALVGSGISETRAKVYEDRVNAGDIMVTASADEAVDVVTPMIESGAMQVETYKIP
jgi:hypothetical protein